MPPTILADDASLADDAVTGNQIGERIGSNGGANGAGGVWRSDGFGEMAVAHNRTGRNAQQGSPHTKLEGCGTNKGFQIATGAVLEYLRGDFTHGGIAPAEASFRPGCLDLAAIFVFDKGEVAEASRAVSEAGEAKGRLRKTRDDLPTFATGFDFAGRGSLQGHAEIVKTAR